MSAKKKTPRPVRREIIRKAAAKDRAVLDRLREHDEGKPAKKSDREHLIDATEMARLLAQELKDTKAKLADMTRKHELGLNAAERYADAAEEAQAKVKDLEQTILQMAQEHRRQLLGSDTETEYWKREVARLHELGVINAIGRAVRDQK